MKYLPIVALIALAILASINLFTNIPFYDDVEQIVLQQFLTLILFALVIERVVEVYANNQFFEREMKESRDVRVQQRKIAYLEKALTAEHEIATLTGVAVAGNDDMKRQSTSAIEDLRQQLSNARRKKLDADERTLENRMVVQRAKTFRSLK